MQDILDIVNTSQLVLKVDIEGMECKVIIRTRLFSDSTQRQIFVFIECHQLQHISHFLWWGKGMGSEVEYKDKSSCTSSICDWVVFEKSPR
jgi:hypothetical protein